MTSHIDNAGPATPLPQGDPRLLDTDAARQLLASTVPARMGYLAAHGTPRVVPTWFHWTGEELLMGAPPNSPKMKVLAVRPQVAVSIDTVEWPYQWLTVRGTAAVQVSAEPFAEYPTMARRYLGQHAAEEYLAFLDDPITVMARIALRPTWVGLIDFQTRNPRTLGGVG